MTSTENAFSLADNLEYLLLSIAFAMLVGIAEIISRYKDEPFFALRSVPGVIYFLINGAAGAGAYFLLIHYQGKVFTDLGSDKLLTAFVAGFGAMVVLRSKLFTFTATSGETYSIGPDFVLSTILGSVDDQIDRLGSRTRTKLVLENLPLTNDSGAAIRFIGTSLASYQNLTDIEKRNFTEVINEVESKQDLTPKLKLMAVSFGLLNLGGQENYIKLMHHLKEHLVPPPPPQT